MARKRGNRWQGDALYNGKRIRKGFPTKHEAEQWEREVADANSRGVPLNSSGDAVTLGEFTREHFEYLWGDTKSKDKIALQVKVVVDLLGTDTPVNTIGEEKLASMVSKLKAKGSANGTINRKLAVISKLLRFAYRMKIVSEVPHIIRLREGKGRTRFLSKPEESALLTAAVHLGSYELARLINFLLYTGARRGEALKVTWRDLDLCSVRQVGGRGVAGSPTVTFWDTKSGDNRTVPLVGPALDAVVRAYHAEVKPTDRVFLLEESAVRHQWDRLREHLGEDEQFVIHMLRHTCASRLVQAGVDLRRVQQFMGHKSIQTTLRYAHLAPKDLDAAAMALVA